MVLAVTVKVLESLCGLVDHAMAPELKPWNAKIVRATGET
jgi:hypothetical protein